MNCATAALAMWLSVVAIAGAAPGHRLRDILALLEHDLLAMPVANQLERASFFDAVNAYHAQDEKSGEALQELLQRVWDTNDKNAKTSEGTKGVSCGTLGGKGEPGTRHLIMGEERRESWPFTYEEDQEHSILQFTVHPEHTSDPSRQGFLPFLYLHQLTALADTDTPSGTQLLTLVTAISCKLGLTLVFDDASDIKGLRQRTHGAVLGNGHQAYYEKRGFEYDEEARRDVLSAAIRAEPLAGHLDSCPRFAELVGPLGLEEGVPVGAAYTALGGIDYAGIEGMENKFDAFKIVIAELAGDETPVAALRGMSMKDALAEVAGLSKMHSKANICDRFNF